MWGRDLERLSGCHDFSVPESKTCTDQYSKNKDFQPMHDWSR